MKFFDLIFPNNIYCIACGRPLPPGLDISLCERCTEEIQWVSGRLCEKCGKPLADNNHKSICHDCSETEHYFDKGYACALYNGHAANIIRDMKYRDKPAYGDVIAALMMARLRAAANSDTGEMPAWDAVVSVPMYREKKEKRGYNQADVIARGLAKRQGLPFRANIIQRNRDTGIMSKLSLEDRRQNLAGAFYISPASIKGLSGKSVLLVDDVYTTGSTADACAWTLHFAGCNTVDLITFAVGADAGQKSAQDIVQDAELFYNSADNPQIGL